MTVKTAGFSPLGRAAFLSLVHLSYFWYLRAEHRKPKTDYSAT